MNFGEAFLSIRAELGIPANPRVGSVTPGSLLNVWEAFAEKCEDGFSDSIEEYYGMLGVRSVLFSILTHPALMAYVEIVDLAYAVARIDKRVVEAFDFEEGVQVSRAGIPDGTAWYWHHFPKSRGLEFAEDLRQHYGIGNAIK